MFVFVGFNGRGGRGSRGGRGDRGRGRGWEAHTMAILVASLFFPKMYPAKPFPKMRVEVGSVLTTGMAGPGGGWCMAVW